MKFKLNWLSGSEKTVLICCWDSNMSNFGRKVNLDLWNLFIGSVVLGKSYRDRIMALASTVFK